MEAMITTREAASRWGLSERRVAVLCKEGRLPGAMKQGKSWMIPSDVQRPEDHRIKTGAYRRAREAGKALLPLPVGISDYRTASSQYYYVDKTLLIRDFLDEIPKVSLFTRPRRFGKTLNMDMLRVFFEKTDEDTSVYFQNRAIWSCGQKYRDYQGKYPVIFVSFKDVKCETWEETVEKLAALLGSEFSRHAEVLESPRCDEMDKAFFRSVMRRQATPIESPSRRPFTPMIYRRSRKTWKSSCCNRSAPMTRSAKISITGSCWACAPYWTTDIT